MDITKIAAGVMAFNKMNMTDIERDIEIISHDVSYAEYDAGISAIVNGSIKDGGGQAKMLWIACRAFAYGRIVGIREERKRARRGRIGETHPDISSSDIPGAQQRESNGKVSR